MFFFSPPCNFNSYLYHLETLKDRSVDAQSKIRLTKLHRLIYTFHFTTRGNPSFRTKRGPMETDVSINQFVLQIWGCV